MRYLAWIAALLLSTVAASAQTGPISGGGGGGSVSVTASGSCVVVTPSPITGTGTIGLAVTDNSKTANYSAAAGDMCNAINLSATTGTPALTLPAASATIFAPGMSVAISVTGTVAWTVTNSTGLTLSAVFPTTLYPGMGGTIVANADGTHLDWFGSSVGSTTVAGVYKVDGSTITVSGGVISSAGGGGGISCPAGFTQVVASCEWTITASNSANLAWTGLTLSEYTMRCRSLIGASGSPTLAVQVGEGGTPTWGTSAAYNTEQNAEFGSVNHATSSTTDKGLVSSGTPTSGTLGTNFTANFHGLAAAGVTKTSDATIATGVPGLALVNMVSSYTADTNAVTALRLIDTQGSPANITSGVCTLIAIGP